VLNLITTTTDDYRCRERDENEEVRTRKYSSENSSGEESIGLFIDRSSWGYRDGKRDPIDLFRLSFLVRRFGPIWSDIKLGESQTENQRFKRPGATLSRLRVPAYASRLPILFLARSSTRGWPQHVLRNLRNALNGNAGFFRVPLRFYLATTCAITPCDSSISMMVRDKDTMEMDFRFTQTAAARAR